MMSDLYVMSGLERDLVGRKREVGEKGGRMIKRGEMYDE